ncbi:MFS transporter [Myxococcota bacterium]|nr:MFS transporter [Myxococcota bacterium]
MSAPNEPAEPELPIDAPLAPLRVPAFSLFAGSRFCSVTASALFSASVAWQVFDLSGSAFDLGLIGLTRFVPHLALSLLGGAVADVFDRRRLIMASQIVPLICGVSLWLASADGSANLPLIYAMVFAVGSAAAFESPAGSALLPTLVPRAMFPRAVTISSTLISLARVTGPALTGLVIAAVSVSASYAVQAGLVVLSLIGLIFVRSRVPPEAGGRVTVQAIVEGIHYVRQRREVLGAMTLDMFAVIFGGATALLPIYANEILQVGPRGYGLLTASLEIGSLSMALLLIFLPPMRRMGRALMIAVAIYGLATILFGLSRSFPLSVLAYMVVGMADQVSVVARQTLIQLATPDALRGRVSSVNMIFIGASNHLGAVEAGFVAALSSATVAVVSGGLGCLTVLGIVAAKLPELGRYRTDRNPTSSGG